MSAHADGLTDAQLAQLCQTCVLDPKAPPGRYCPRFACVCGHPTCPAFQSYIARPAPDPLPDNVKHLTAHRPDTGQSAWDQRDEPSWIDQL